MTDKKNVQEVATTPSSDVNEAADVATSDAPTGNCVNHPDVPATYVSDGVSAAKLGFCDACKPVNAPA